MPADEDGHLTTVNFTDVWDSPLSLEEMIDNALDFLGPSVRLRPAVDGEWNAFRSSLTPPVPRLTAYTDGHGRTLALLVSPPDCRGEAKLFALPEFVRLLEALPEGDASQLLGSLFGILVKVVDSLPDFPELETTDASG